jgi:hypothetical protein
MFNEPAVSEPTNIHYIEIDRFPRSCLYARTAQKRPDRIANFRYLLWDQREVMNRRSC